MNRILHFFTVERTTGLIMIVTAGLLIPRPYVSALEVLEDAYRITLTLTVLSASLWVFAGYLMLRKRVDLPMFVLCLSPMWLYALALFVIFLLSPRIGPFGFIYGFWACGITIYIHSLREKPAPVTPPTEPPKT